MSVHGISILGMFRLGEVPLGDLLLTLVPDLGWPNTDDMFDSGKNPGLRQLYLSELESTLLEDKYLKGLNTLVFTCGGSRLRIPLAIARDLPKSPKFLWRLTGISTTFTFRFVARVLPVEETAQLDTKPRILS